MLETIAIILILLWIFGAVSIATLGWFVQILLVAAVVFLVVRLVETLAG